MTRVLSYEDLFAVNAGEKSEREKTLAVRLEKKYETKKISKKVDLVKKAKVEEQNQMKRLSRLKEVEKLPALTKKNRNENKVTEEIGTSGEDLGGQKGESSIKMQDTEMISSGTEKFGESLSGQLEYEESWKEYINGE